MRTDVFVDLEGIGISWGIRTSARKIGLIARKLPGALMSRGYAIGEVACFASDSRPPEWMSPKIKGTMRSLTDEWGWNMVWTHTIADHALMRAVEDGMAYGTLPKAVMIVANDHHFCDIVCKLAATGRTALVSGTKVSKRLREASSACFELWDLIGENPEKVDWQSYDERHKGTPAFNGIRFPEGL